MEGIRVLASALTKWGTVNCPWEQKTFILWESVAKPHLKMQGLSLFPESSKKINHFKVASQGCHSERSTHVTPGPGEHRMKGFGFTVRWACSAQEAQDDRWLALVWKSQLWKDHCGDFLRAFWIQRLFYETLRCLTLGTTQRWENQNRKRWSDSSRDTVFVQWESGMVGRALGREFRELWMPMLGILDTQYHTTHNTTPPFSQ